MDAFDAANTAPAAFVASGDVETQFMTQRSDSLQGFRQTDNFLRARLAFTGGTTITFVLPTDAVVSRPHQPSGATRPPYCNSGTTVARSY